MTRAASRAAVLSLAVLLMAVGTTWWRVDLDRQVRTLSAAVASMTAQLKTPAPYAAKQPRGEDFVQRLQATASVDPIVREVQRASAAEGVAFLSVSSTPRLPTVQTLGRTELSIGLRGAYPQLKSVVAQTLDRFPELVVQRLVIRRLASPAELEARVELLLLTSPLAASAAAR